MPRGFFSDSDSSKSKILRAPEGRVLSLNGSPVKDKASEARSLARCSNTEARKLLSYENALRLTALPLGLIKAIKRDFVTVAVPESFDQEALKSLRFAINRELKLITTKSELIKEAIFIAYKGDALELSTNLPLGNSDCISNPSQEDLPELKQGSAAYFLHALIEYAAAHQASDLHILPRRQGTQLRMRINGELLTHQDAVCSLNEHQKIINRIKVLAHLDTTIHKLPQDGSFSVLIAGQDRSIRASLMPTIWGEKAVLRITHLKTFRTLNELGLSQLVLNLLMQVCHARQGAVLFCGPTGSGKTTTMYSVLEALKGKNLNLLSIEDPVEAIIEGVSQTSINEELGLSYARCLKALLRQDPDIILLGEIRDEESAKRALQATLTGHLLLSSVHARNVFEVLLRLRDLGVNSLTIAQGVKLILCQRLVPLLCGKCKVSDLANSNYYGHEVYRAVGCSACDYTGYQGRKLLVELLLIDQSLSTLIAEKELKLSALKQKANSSNYQSMESALVFLLKRGMLDIDNFLVLREQ